METKICKTCQKEKSLNDFYRVRKERTRTECKSCELLKLKQRNLSRKEKIDEYQRNYRKENVDKIRERSHNYYKKNREALLSWQKAYYEKNPEKQIKRGRIWRINAYGLTESQFNTMVLAQAGRCAICSGPPISGGRLHIDHCHKTGRVRGLLCDTCNKGLGFFKDDEFLMQKALKYLQRPDNSPPSLDRFLANMRMVNSKKRSKKSKESA